MYSVSVIIPVFNVEKYIERCAVSLFEQTLSSIEYIFINDCTPDNSMEVLKKVLERYPLRAKHALIVNNEKNLGVAMSRDKGHFIAKGEYVIDCDSDDWIEPEMYEKLYRKAKLNDSDIIVCNWNNIFKKGIRAGNIDFLFSSKECIISLLNGNTPGFLWNKLIKRSLYVNYKITGVQEINCLEDLFLLFRIFFYSKKIDYLDIRFYNYNRQNISSATYNRISENAQSSMLALIPKVQEFFYKNQVIDSDYWLSVKNLEIRIYSIILLKGMLSESILQKCSSFKMNDIFFHPSLPLLYKFVLLLACFNFKTMLIILRYFYKKII